MKKRENFGGSGLTFVGRAEADYVMTTLIGCFGNSTVTAESPSGTCSCCCLSRAFQHHHHHHGSLSTLPPKNLPQSNRVVDIRYGISKDLPARPQAGGRTGPDVQVCGASGAAEVGMTAFIIQSVAVQLQFSSNVKVN